MHKCFLIQQNMWKEEISSSSLSFMQVLSDANPSPGSDCLFCQRFLEPFEYRIQNRKRGCRGGPKELTLVGTDKKNNVRSLLFHPGCHHPCLLFNHGPVKNPTRVHKHVNCMERGKNQLPDGPEMVEKLESTCSLNKRTPWVLKRHF